MKPKFVYKNETTNQFYTKENLVVGKDQVIGLLVEGIVLPFAPRILSWSECQRMFDIPEATELLAGWSEEVSDTFNHVANAFCQPMLQELSIPVQSFPADQWQMKKDSHSAPFFLYRYGDVGVGWRDIPKMCRVAWRWHREDD